MFSCHGVFWVTFVVTVLRGKCKEGENEWRENTDKQNRRTGRTYSHYRIHLFTVTCVVLWVGNFVSEGHTSPYSWSDLKRQEICSSQKFTVMYKEHKTTRCHKIEKYNCNNSHEICERIILKSVGTWHILSKHKMSTLHLSLKQLSSQEYMI